MTGDPLYPALLNYLIFVLYVCFISSASFYILLPANVANKNTITLKMLQIYIGERGS